MSVLRYSPSLSPTLRASKSADNSPELQPLVPKLKDGKTGENLKEKDAEDEDLYDINSGQGIALLGYSMYIYFALSMLETFFTPFLPKIAKRYGMESWNGLIIAADPFMIFILSPVAGAVTPKLGFRYTLIIALSVSVCSCALMAFMPMWCQPDGNCLVGTLVVTRLLMGVGTAFTFTAVMGFLLVSFKDARAVALASCEGISGVATMIAPAIGGVIYEYSGNKFWVASIVFAALTIPVLPATFCCLQTSKPYKEEESFFTVMMKLLSDWSFIYAFLNIIVMSINLSFFDPGFAIYMDETYQTSTSHTGYLMMIPGFVYMLAMGLFSPLVDSFGNYTVPGQEMKLKITIAVGHAICSVGIYFLAPQFGPNGAKSEAMVAGALAIAGVGIGIMGIALMIDINSVGERCMHRSDASLSVQLSGFLAMSFGGGITTGPLLGNAIGTSLGFPYACFVFSVVSAVACVTAVGVAIIKCFEPAYVPTEEELARLQEEEEKKIGADTTDKDTNDDSPEQTYDEEKTHDAVKTYDAVKDAEETYDAVKEAEETCDAVKDAEEIYDAGKEAEETYDAVKNAVETYDAV